MFNSVLKHITSTLLFVIIMKLLHSLFFFLRNGIFIYKTKVYSQVYNLLEDKGSINTFRKDSSIKMHIQIIQIILRSYIYIWSSLLYIHLHVGSHLLADTTVKDDGNFSIQIALQISVRQNSEAPLWKKNSCTSTFFEVLVMAIRYRIPQWKFFDPKN